MPESFTAFESEIGRFPREVRKRLEKMTDRCGVLSAADVHKLNTALGVNISQLMVKLLPVAAAFARTPVSNFPVGAVAAGVPTGAGAVPLYLGANFEVAERHLGLTVHAEQAATVNAWLHGELGLSSLAASAVPCGHCRQFLNELSRASALNIIWPDSKPAAYESTSLLQLLPDAFGPANLGIQGAFMGSDNEPPDLIIANSHLDDLQTQALHAAQASYGPYTGAFAGCAIATNGEQVFVGRGVENAAFNPSLTAVQAAFAILNMSRARGDLAAITRVVLVERAPTVTQLPFTRSFIDALTPHVTLEYFRATVRAG
jgi:cytidine deaminase